MAEARHGEKVWQYTMGSGVDMSASMQEDKMTRYTIKKSGDWHGFAVGITLCLQCRCKSLQT